MKIINYSICIELAMNRILRFPVVFNIQDAEIFFVRLKNESKNPTDDSYYAEALTLLRCAMDYNASLSGICSEFINRKPICRFSFSFNELKTLQEFHIAVNSNQKRDVC